MRWTGLISKDCYRACKDANPDVPCAFEEATPAAWSLGAERKLPDACGPGKCRRLSEDRAEVRRKQEAEKAAKEA